MKSKSIINRSANYEYSIEDKFEAGIVLTGPEVKSIRLGRIQLKDSFAHITDGEAFLVNAHISAYQFSSNEDYDPTKSRKLLLKKKQIDELRGKLSQKGYVLVPTKIYEKNNKFKVELGLGRGKKQYEKREKKKRQDIKREVAREIKAKYKG
jgi:SsrA-binding protein